MQKRAARFVTGNYNYETGSMTGILGQLKWESLKKRRKDNRLILLYKGLKGKAFKTFMMCIPRAHQVHNLYTLVQILLCSSHFPLPCIRFTKFVRRNQFDETGPWSVSVAETDDKPFC